VWQAAVVYFQVSLIFALFAAGFAVGILLLGVFVRAIFSG